MSETIDSYPADDAGRGRGFRAAVRRLNPGRYIRRHHFRVTLSLLIASFILVLLWSTIVVPINAGHEGVYWSRFLGGTRNTRLTEGTRLKFPWDSITVYDIRMQADREVTNVLTEDGMTVAIDFVAHYRPLAGSLPLLHRTLGPAYAGNVVIPIVVSAVREILGNYSADEIYTRDKSQLLSEVDALVSRRVESYPVDFQAVLLLKIELPPLMAAGIVEKLLQEQKFLAYSHILNATEAERQRKEIEARGIRTFEDVSGISMLRWRGLDVTSELAKSPNAKIVIMGTGADGLPLILNTDR